MSKHTLIVLVALLAVPMASLLAQSKAPAKPKLPWVATEDMTKLQGTWKAAENRSGFRVDRDEGNKELVDALLDKDAVLEFTKGQLTFSNAKLTTTAANDKNNPEDVFKYGTFANTTEPYLTITPKEGKPITVSYIVGENGLSIRYPARSCSRSGMQITFVRAAK